MTEIKSKSTFETIVTIRNGAVRHVTGSYIYHPKTNFNGVGIKWFDDSKLVKGGARA